MASALEVASKLGDAVGGFTALAAFLWAAIWGVPRWRAQRAEEKRREAAGQCYVAVSHALDAMDLWAYGVAKAPSENTKSAEPILVWAGREYRQGFEWSLRALGALESVGPIADVYLPTQAAEPVEAASNLQSKMVAQFRALETESATSPEELIEKLRGFSRFQSEASEIQKRAKEHMLPLARFEG